MKTKQKTENKTETTERPQGTPITEVAKEKLNAYFNVENNVLMMRNINVSAIAALMDEEMTEFMTAVAEQDGPAMMDAIFDLIGAACMLIDGVDSWIVHECINEYFHAQASRNRKWMPHMAVIQSVVSRLANGRQQMMTFEGPEFAKGPARGAHTSKMLEGRGAGKAYKFARSRMDTLKDDSDEVVWSIMTKHAIEEQGVNIGDNQVYKKAALAQWNKDKTKSTSKKQAPAETTSQVSEPVSEPSTDIAEEITSGPVAYVIATKMRGAGFMGGAHITVPAGTPIKDAVDANFSGVRKWSGGQLHDLTGFDAVDRQATAQPVTKLAKLKTAINKAAKAAEIKPSNPDGCTFVIEWPKPIKIAENSTMKWNHKASEAQITAQQHKEDEMNA